MADRLRAEWSAKTDLTKTSSSASQLQSDPVVCGEGDPTHTPDRVVQKYIDNDTGTEWNWWSATWVHQ